jgi:hypothetical protein
MYQGILIITVRSYGRFRSTLTKVRFENIPHIPAGVRVHYQ